MENTRTLRGLARYWHVDNVEGMLDRLLSMGATLYEKIMIRGDGFVTASVVDPFGNLLGVMYNRHYLEIVNKKAQRQ